MVKLVDDRVRIYVTEQPPEPVLSGVLPPGAGQSTIAAEMDDEGDAIFKSLSVSAPDNQPLAENRAGQHALVVLDSALAWCLLGGEQDFRKADAGSIPPDARWITEHIPMGRGRRVSLCWWSLQAKTVPCG